MNDKDKEKCCEKCRIHSMIDVQFEGPKHIYTCGDTECSCHQEKKESWSERFDEKFEELYEPEMTEGDVIRAFSGVKPLADRVKSFISQELETARKERDEMWRERIKDWYDQIPSKMFTLDISDLLNEQ